MDDPYIALAFEARRLLADRPLELVHQPFDLRIIWRQAKGAPVDGEGLGELAPTLPHVGEAAERRQILWRETSDVLELGEGGIQLPRLKQRSAERDARRDVAGVPGETGTAGGDGFVEQPGAATLLRQLRKCNRRRILLDPASKIVKSGVVHLPRHPAPYCTVRMCEMVLLVPLTS